MRFIGAIVAGVVALANPASAQVISNSSAFRLGEQVVYTTGNFGAFNFAFNMQGLPFRESNVIQKPTFPAGSLIQWDMQATTCQSVCGYLHQDFGAYECGVPQTPITPKQVNNIGTLTASHDLTISGTTNGFDVIYDIFLKNQVSCPSTNLFEVEIFMTSPQIVIDFFNLATPKGSTTVSGILWDVALSGGNDILFKPHDNSSVPIATLDFKAMLLYAKTQSILNGTEIYEGHSLGIEPKSGIGSVKYNAMSAVYN